MGHQRKTTTLDRAYAIFLFDQKAQGHTEASQKIHLSSRYVENKRDRRNYADLFSIFY